MDLITPERFWNAYKMELLELAKKAETKLAYRSDFKWTPCAIGAAERVMTQTLKLNFIATQETGSLFLVLAVGRLRQITPSLRTLIADRN